MKARATRDEFLSPEECPRSANIGRCAVGDGAVAGYEAATPLPGRPWRLMGKERSPWLDLDLQHLATFIALAEERSFRATATRLGFAQSAISQHILTLETRVGARLVERGPGTSRVRLTEAGRSLLEHAQAILARVAIAQRDFAQQRDRALETVSIGVFQSVSATFATPVVAATARQRSTLRVQLVNCENPIEELVSGRVDLALSESVPANKSVRHIELLKDPYVLLAPRDGSAASGAVGLDQLARLPLITYDSSCHLREVEQEARQTKGLDLRRAKRADDVLTMQSMVAHGLGFALVPSLALATEDPRLVAHPVEAIRPRSICLVWNAEREPTEAMRALIAAFKVAAGERQR